MYKIETNQFPSIQQYVCLYVCIYKTVLYNTDIYIYVCAFISFSS